jgi:hypothetical protein
LGLVCPETSGYAWIKITGSRQEREDAVAEHRFYVEQAKNRLLSQFGNISAEADQAEQEHWDASGRSFNPDFDDEGSLAEAARDYGVAFYQLLTEMHDRTRLSVVAGMYHHWDKRFRRFLVREMRWCGLVPGEHTRRALWKVDSAKLEQFLLTLGLDVRAFPRFDRLDAMRLVVNVFKHGEGKSLDDLRQLYPEFVPFSGPYVPRYLDDTDMVVTDAHVEEFAGAIEAFWRAVPKELLMDDSIDLDVPDEIAKGHRKDMEALAR